MICLYYRRSYINAFKKWTDVTPLDIREVSSGDADILISYARGNHYDGSPFDGRGKDRIMHEKIKETKNQQYLTFQVDQMY